MTEPGKRGGGFRPGGAADKVVKKRAARLLATQDGTTIQSLEDVERLFRLIADEIKSRGTAIGQFLHDAKQLEHWTLHMMPVSQVGPFEQIEGPDICVYRRPKAPAKFGWLNRIDIRRGSPTALKTLLKHLKGSTDG